MRTPATTPAARTRSGAPKADPAATVPPLTRRLRRPGRLARVALATLVLLGLTAPVAGAAPVPAAPAPAPLDLPAGTPPEARRAAQLSALTAAARMAGDGRHPERAAALASLAADRPNLLEFDGRGPGRLVEVFGDLSRARRVAVLVPGSDTSLDTYRRMRDGAAALHERLSEADTPTAVVAWLGYTTPETVGGAVVTTARADEGARALGPFLDRLARLTGPDTRFSLLCHSYGSVVCARTDTGPAVADLVLYGSPGTGDARTAADLPTPARVWAARGSADWIADIPHVRIGDLGLGTDPMTPSFGARILPAGDGGHSDYLRPGSVPLDSLARVVLGTATP
ncbi:alpha/beta hydrolase [Streptomyces sp. BI20]|uniref:alpha/beta hydrolase n=1 Tax=Streptomyces sp. BI20 TaxID=3403460 RepID=UPI003C7509B1